MLIYGRHNMNDPVGAFEQIRDGVLLYLKTAFATQYPSVEIERERLLRTLRTFYQEPWIRASRTLPCGETDFESYC